MLQELFRIHLFGHEFPIYGYGLMLVAAFLACVKLSQWLGLRKGIRPEWFVDATLIALASGLIGARLCHVLENLHEYTRGDLTLAQNLRNVLNTREGGLTFYGGFLLATPCCILYALYRRVPILLGMDIVAPVVMIGLGFGRIGCFLNGCCYGQQCNVPWAVRFPYFSNVYVEQYQQGKLVAPMELQSPLGLMNPHNPPISTDPNLRAKAAAALSLPVHPTQLLQRLHRVPPMRPADRVPGSSARRRTGFCADADSGRHRTIHSGIDPRRAERCHAARSRPGVRLEHQHGSWTDRRGGGHRHVEIDRPKIAARVYVAVTQLPRVRATATFPGDFSFAPERFAVPTRSGWGRHKRMFAW